MRTHQLALMERMGEHDTATWQGKVVATWRGHEAAQFDITTLRSEMPEIAARYTETVQRRQFLGKWKELT